MCRVLPIGKRREKMQPMRFNPLRFNGIFFALIIILVIGGFPGRALAHRVTIFAWVDGDTVYTQSRFSGGKAVKNGDVFVYDSQGNRLLAGKTDAVGEFTFKLPGKTDLRVVLNAGMGHGNEWILSADDIDPAGKKAGGTRPSASFVKPILAPSPAPDGLTRDDIKSIVDSSIDNKLKPMMKLISELRNDDSSFTDILGGIGYIIGLIGLAAYIHARKKR